MHKSILLSVLGASLLLADAQTDSLQTELHRQQQTIDQLQQRLDAIEKDRTKRDKTLKEAHKAEQERDLEAKMSQASQDYSSSFSQQEYLPDIALILNSSAVARDVKNSDYADYSIPGFIAPGDADIPFNLERGFNLNYAEVAMHSAVDPYFDAFAVFHMQSDAFEIDEAYVTTRDLPAGLRIKAGKFKSAIGRMNEKHQHAWNFSTQPLIYSALFGPEGVSDPGVQLQWVAPTDTYLLAGIEALQGSNEQSFGETEKNNLYAAYLKSSLDVDDLTSILMGASLLHGKNPQGDTDIYGADLTLRRELGSYSSLTWQSEYLHRDMDTLNQTQDQGGLYTQLVYGYDRNWKGGVRYDSILKNSDGPDDLEIYTAMVQYNPFPFSRLRLQYSHDRSKVIDGERRDFDQLILELNIAVGAHGAHSY